MLLANKLNIRGIKISPKVRAAAKDAEVNIFPVERESHDVLDSMPEIVTCSWAWPHNDYGGYSGQLFLTLSLISSHEVSDLTAIRANERLPIHSRQNSIAYPVGAGTLFVVDAGVTHWLMPKDAWMETKPKPWAGLQWTVPRKDAKKVARAIVEKYSGTWLPTSSIEPRYRAFKPTESETQE